MLPVSQSMRVMIHALAASTVVLSILVGAPVQAQTRPALVRDVDNGALQSFRAFIGVVAVASEGFKSADGPVVPAGKRLVIENASVWAFTDANDYVTGVWLTVPGAAPATFALLDPASTERKTVGVSSTVTAYNRTVKLYYNAGETVQLQTYFLGTTSLKIVNVYLNGYLVTL